MLDGPQKGIPNCREFSATVETVADTGGTAGRFAVSIKIDRNGLTIDIHLAGRKVDIFLARSD